jgi:hypothetical protein
MTLSRLSAVFSGASRFGVWAAIGTLNISTATASKRDITAPFKAEVTIEQGEFVAKGWP